MNYYEHHIGDYDEATAHLTACEDGIYSRLIRKYYSTEKALPNDIPALQRLVRARSRDEKAAVKTILEEFFELRDDGWHQARCDEDLEKYFSGEPERALKKTNEDNRLKRHREERARLFKIITDAGLHAPWNIGMSELRALAATRSATAPETAPEMEGPPLPATAPATPATATQTPDTRHQTPEVKPEVLANAGGNPRASAVRPSDLSAAMRRHSIEAQPADPRIVAAAAAGVTPETVEAACAEAKASDTAGRIKAGYVLAIAERWTREASQPRANTRSAPRPSRDEQIRAISDANAAAWLAQTPAADPSVIDMEP